MQVKDHLSLSNFIIHLFNFLHEHKPPNKYNSDQDYKALCEILLNKNLESISINNINDDDFIITLSTDASDFITMNFICILGYHEGRDISINIVPGCSNIIAIKLNSTKLPPFAKDFIGTEYILCPRNSENYEFMSYDEMDGLLLQFICR